MAVSMGDGISVGNIVAAADLSAKQYRAVKLTSSGWNVASSAGEATHGILQDTPTSGEPCSVVMTGPAKALLGGTVSVGSILTTDNAGKLVASTDPTTQNKIGIALAAGVSGDVIPVYVGQGRALDLTV